MNDRDAMCRSWTRLAKAKVVRCCGKGCIASLVLVNHVQLDPMLARSYQASVELEHKAIAGAGWMVTSGIVMCPSCFEVVGEELTDEARRAMAKERRTLLRIDYVRG